MWGMKDTRHTAAIKEPFIPNYPERLLKNATTTPKKI
jgi:hypothetical protein